MEGRVHQAGGEGCEETQVIREPLEQDGQRYEGVVKVVRMWTHYEGLR